MRKCRCFVNNQKLYTSVDNSWRICISKMFIYPNKYKIYKPCYIGGNKIHFIADENSFVDEPTVRVYLPAKIREIMDIHVDDVFEITHCDNGFVLEKVEKENIQ